MTIVPQRFLHYLNSAEEIREYYPAIKKWIAYNLDRAKKKRPENEGLPEGIGEYILDCAENWGEWCEPGRVSKDYAVEGQENGHAEIATAFLAYDCYLARDMASRLGEEEDAAYYGMLYERVREAYRFVFTDHGRIESQRQCHYVRPVAHKLLNEQETVKATADLAELIRKNGNRIGTGFLTTCHLCETLTDNGYASVAYDLLLQREQPSWLFEVLNGATTIWENWYGIREGREPRGSHNHYSLGAVTGWMISRALGIVVSDGEITVRPYPDARLGYAKGSYLSVLGRIGSAWEYTDAEIRFTVEIPANAEATVILPDGRQRRVSAGQHSFCVAR